MELRELESEQSLSVQLWKEARERVRELARTAGNVLFIARDAGSLFGLKKNHGDIVGIGFYALTPDKAHVFHDLGMKFEYAFLVDQEPQVIEGITPIVTGQLTIARRIRKKR